MINERITIAQQLSFLDEQHRIVTEPLYKEDMAVKIAVAVKRNMMMKTYLDRYDCIDALYRQSVLANNPRRACGYLCLLSQTVDEIVRITESVANSVR